jgi:serine phosphatase RsbU (regulator of sigma subunit)/anti-sigma regulatory factor (Ser/Thr protein kinase)/anti-anti-sigma regulatory factor
MLDQVYATGTPHVGREWRLQVVPEGSAVLQRFLDFTVTPVLEQDNTVSGLTLLITDVTERVRTREAAQAREAEVERRYEAARDVVIALQEALLPKGLPVLPGARIAARYLVAGQYQAAGGGWFDAIPLGDGWVALVVGDVVGHGVAASAAMGQLRAVLRHVLAVEPDLAAALGQLDGFAASDPALRAATLCVVVLSPADGAVRYATCGHPPPLVITPDGAARFLPATGGGPLGTGSVPVLSSAELAAGELVLLYSDGLIERPGRTLAEGMEELAVVAGDTAASRTLPAAAATTPADRVCQLGVELLTRAGYVGDVTTLAAQRLTVPVPELTAELPAEPGSVITMRRALDDWLDEIGVATADRQVVELAVTEAVTNAAEHAYPPGRAGTIRLEAALGADGYLEARVSDRGRWRVPDPGIQGRGQGLMLAAQLAGQLRVSHPPQEATAPPGSKGTVVILRHSLQRPAMLASDATIQPVSGGHVSVSVPFAARLVASEPGAEPAANMRVAGPVDVTTAERFTGRLLSACRAGVLPLTVDLTGVTILASAGIRVLHEVRDQLAAHGNTLTLVTGADSAAAAVLDIVRLPYTANGAGPGVGR